jgi:hypothetical protein
MYLGKCSHSLFDLEDSRHLPVSAACMHRPPLAAVTDLVEQRSVW